MKKVFYIGLLLLFAFEVLRVYFIMPMPGSQGLDSVEWAHFLHVWRWGFRIGLGALIVLGIRDAWKGRRWVMLATAVLLFAVIGLLNFKLSAEKMFLMPERLVMSGADANQVDGEKLVVGISYQGNARAYPIQYLAYHHQVLDTLGGKVFMVTYCSVCRTGRVFEPVIEGKQVAFRLVGMEHFNAMFEDDQSGSWWHQATGEAVAGPLKGTHLPEFPCQQTTLNIWLGLHPNSRVMQADPAFEAEYAALEDYESGQSKDALVGTDTTTWAEKSWVVGIDLGGQAKAFPWNILQRERVIADEVGTEPILLLLGEDDQSFFAFAHGAAAMQAQVLKDTLFLDGRRYSLDGIPYGDGTPLKPIRAYQEFWHSWRTFHPETEKYTGKR